MLRPGTLTLTASVLEITSVTLLRAGHTTEDDHNTETMIQFEVDVVDAALDNAQSSDGLLKNQETEFPPRLMIILAR